MDTKAAFDREAFEKFITDEAIKRNYQFMDNLFSKFGDDYSVTWVDMAWMGWTASRAAIEIDLPEEMREVVADTLIHGRVMANDMLRDCTKAITSHGIRIKGKSE